MQTGTRLSTSGKLLVCLLQDVHVNVLTVKTPKGLEPPTEVPNPMAHRTKITNLYYFVFFIYLSLNNVLLFF